MNTSTSTSTTSTNTHNDAVALRGGPAFQPTVNIGLVGHVAHGKSSLVYALSGERTQRHKKEAQLNCTVKLGYSSAKIYRCGAEEGHADEASRYCSTGSDARAPARCEACGAAEAPALRSHISFVDCPGHEALMATMLAGAAMMDAAVLVVGANAACPQRQTEEHLAVMDLMQMDQMAIVQNKAELVPAAAAAAQSLKIREFVAGTVAAESPIVPVSALAQHNLDAVAAYLGNIQSPDHREQQQQPVLARIVRSFDVNSPGTGVQRLLGGVVGGTILRGSLTIDDVVEVRPGVRLPDGRWQPLLTRVSSLKSGNNWLDYALPGGLIGIGTTLDPSLTRGDGLIGQLVGRPGSLPAVYRALRLRVHAMRRVVGASAEPDQASGKKKAPKVKLEVGQELLLHIGTKAVSGKIVKLGQGGKVASLTLARPVCVLPEERIAVSMGVGGQFHLAGWGEFRSGTEQELAPLPSPPSQEPRPSEEEAEEAEEAEEEEEEQQPEQPEEEEQQSRLQLHDYDALLDRFSQGVQRTHGALLQQEKLKVAAPQMARDGGRRVVWTNFGASAAALNRPIEHLQRFVLSELACDGTLNSQQQLTLLGNFRDKHMRRLLLVYAKEFVQCQQCHGPDTTMERDERSNLLRMHCASCGSDRTVKPIEAAFRAASRASRRAARNA